MTKPLSDERLAAAMVKRLVGPGHAMVEKLREDFRRGAAPLLRIEGVGQVINEVDALREVAATLAAEVRAFRDNVQIARDAPPSRLQSCLNCISFDASKTTEAHVAVQRQAIVQEAGACRHNPPAGIPRMPTAAGGTPVASFFPPVWPDQWCRRWEQIENRKVPTQ